MHDAYIGDVQRITLNALSCIMISGGRTKQLDIIAGFLWNIFGSFMEPFNVLITAYRSRQL